MLRSILIYLSKASWAKKIVTGWTFAWRAASRFIAGEKLDDALKVIRVMNQKGIYTTLDHLGENTHTREDTQRATQEIINILEAITEQSVQSNVSIKLTQIGLLIDDNLCEDNLIKILDTAQKLDNFIRIDIEDATCVDRTINLLWYMREEKKYLCVGMGIQAYLYRSHDDIKNLLQIGAPIRLCKGAYKEPPEIAFPKKKDVDLNFDQLTQVSLDMALGTDSPKTSDNGIIPPLVALATHDVNRINFALDYAREIGLSKRKLEFQLLFGIRRDLQDKLVSEGYPVRVYVPYGTEWYPYFTRRLAERPANLWFFISNYFRN